MNKGSGTHFSKWIPYFTNLWTGSPLCLFLIPPPFCNLIFFLPLKLAGKSLEMSGNTQLGSRA